MGYLELFSARDLGGRKRRAEGRHDLPELEKMAAQWPWLAILVAICACYHALGGINLPEGPAESCGGMAR